MQDPFIVGGIVPVDRFINHQNEIRQAASLLATGQSFALVGSPRSGKTSLLHFLKSPNTQASLYEHSVDELVFHYMDAQAFRMSVSVEQFWNQALEPLLQRIPARSKLHESFLACKRYKFSTPVLEQFFQQLQGDSFWHLVLVLDEFDTVMEHPILHKTEFYGGLRTLASRYGQVFSLVTASSQSLSVLTEKTQSAARGGSPFFNFMREISLGKFNEVSARNVLEQANGRFREAEILYLLHLAGRQPFLLQAAGSGLWKAYENGLLPSEHKVFAGRELFRAATDTLGHLWRSWSAETRRVFAIIALDEMPKLLGDRFFDFDALRKTLLYNPRELRSLEDQGFIIPDSSLPTGWRVSAQVMLWWLAEELITSMGKGDDLGQYLLDNEWDGSFFTKGEKKQFISAVKSLGFLAKAGAESFIKAAAEGYGKGISAK